MQKGSSKFCLLNGNMGFGRLDRTDIGRLAHSVRSTAIIQSAISVAGTSLVDSTLVTKSTLEYVSVVARRRLGTQENA